MVFNMAAVGCTSIERNDMGEKNATKLTLSCKRNGLNHACYCEEKMETRKTSRSQILDKLFKINGSVKSNNNNCFPRPSSTTPSLRSRRERHSSEPENPKRRRRSSRHDPGEAKTGEPPDSSPHMPLTPETPESLEVANINHTFTAHHQKLCNSVPQHTKEIKDLLPLVTGNNGLVPVPFTPDTSRSCTPISLSAGAPSPACSPIGSPFGSPISKGDTTPPKDSSSSAPIKVACQWKDCDTSLINGEILEHIRSHHVLPQKKNETFVCLWKDCKVFNKKACSKHWLDRHILTHCGDKPFRCIVDRCGIRFTSQGGLERHVNSHFSAQQQSPNQKNKHGREETPSKLFKRKRLLKQQKKERMSVKTDDCIDNVTMETLEGQLNTLTERTQLDLNGSSYSVTFHSSVIARRGEDSGKSKFLLRWTPADVLPDEWVSETQVHYLQTRSIPVNCLPRDTITNLHPSLYNPQRHRKHRRK